MVDSNQREMMRKVLGRRIRMMMLAVAIILVSLASISLRYVLAPPPPPPSAPMPLNQYGVVRVYASILFTGTAKIKITSLGFSPFFVSRLTLFLNRPADFDILLDTINVDGTGSIQVSGFLGSSKVVVVPAGLLVGDVLASMPNYLNFLLVKDPMGNDAIVANGGDDSGVIVGVRFLSGAYGGGTIISAIATVVAPTNATVTITMS